VVYSERQLAADREQDEILKNRFEITQSKLDVVINNQTAFTEQLKAYNQIIASYQKQMDSFNERIIYLERVNRINK
jgi:uncharacterized tellurite resistance protein B-like protein